MGERSSSLLAKLTLRTKRQSTASSSTSTRSASSPIASPDSETPPTTSFSGEADYGLGYSSINHERSSTYNAKRTSRALLTRPIEFDRYAESSSPQQQEKAKRTRSLPRSNKLGIGHAEEDSLFVQIVDEAVPTSPIQSTVRARSQSGTSPLHDANFDFARPQSPFTINSIVTRSSSSSNSPLRRPSPRRCHSAIDTPSSSSSPSFYAVARGWRKGVYTTKEDADCQVRNFPGPLMQAFRDRAAAEDFLQNSGRSTPRSPSQDDNEDEFIERLRIFKGLNPNSELARRRSLIISTERNESQRRSRILRASQSPAFQQDAFDAAGATSSPPLSLKSVFADIAPISPIEEAHGSNDFPASAPLSSMTLLPVHRLADSMAFYAKVLDFTCIAHVPDVQAVMSTPAATVCLRTLAQALPTPNGAKVLRKSTASEPLALGRPTLPTMSEEPHDDNDPTLPPTPDSLSLSHPDPEPIQLPPTSLPLRSITPATLSGITVLVEHGGALDALHSRLSAKLNEWRIERNRAAQNCFDGARLLGGVQQTPWDAQELQLCDLDGHRIVYTTPLL